MAQFIGSDSHFLLLAVALLFELAVLALRWHRKPHHVTHRKLRAVSARRDPAAGINTISIASCDDPVAGPELRAEAQPARIGGAAVTTPASSLTPAPSPSAGAGTQHRATTAPLLPGMQPFPDGSGGPARQPVDVDFLRVSTSTGVQPRDREGFQGHESGASDPETGAPVRGAA